MSIQDLAALSGVPGLGHAVTALFKLYESMQDVKVHRHQCKQLHGRCVELLLALRDNDESLFGTDYQSAVDQAELNFERIARKVHTWAMLGSAKSWMRQGDIKQGLDDLNQDLTHIAIRLNVIGHMESFRRTNEIRQVMDQHHMEIEEKLQRLLDNTQDIQQFLKQPDAQIEGDMLSIQQAIHEDTAKPEIIHNLQERLFNIHRKSELLPPMTDLTGEVRRISDHPVSISGGYSDVYLGEWLGNEKVALKLTRGINQTPKAQKRFQNEVEIWRRLQHRNVARLYGVVTIGEHIYSVSPWMEHRDALRYITNNPDADRLKILAEIATGLEFLHRHGVVHGDLRAANILISDAGVACITDFGLSVIIEEEVIEDPSSNASLDLSGNSRWMAPELIKPELIGLESVNRNTASDVWSYGMLCLEIFTGQRPFPNRPHGPSVISDLISGIRPTRPPAEVTQRGLSDAAWKLLLECWRDVPQARPSMSEVVRRMQAFYAARKNSSSSRTPSPRLPISHIPDSPVSPGGSMRNTSSVIPSPSSPIQVPRSSNNMVVKSESPASLTPPTGNQSASTSSSGPLHAQQSGGRRSISNTREFRTVPRTTVQGFNARSQLDTHDNTHLRSASLEVDRVKGTRINQSVRPSTAPGRAVVNPPQLPHIREIHNEVAGEEFEDFSVYFQGGYPERDDIPTVQIERPITPEKPPLSTSVPSSLVMSMEQTPSSPASCVTPSESSEINSIGSPTSISSGDPLPKVPIYIKSGKDGTVKTANLPGLVERLILDSGDRRMDDQLRETFLTSYQAFTDAKTVFELLLERFEAVSRSPHTAEERTTVRHSVIIVLDLWLRNHHVETKDVPLLQRMREFALSVQRPPSGPTLRNRASQLTQLIDSREEALLSSAPPLSPSSSTSSIRSVSRPSEMTPEALAVALTEIESKRFQKIIPSDCIGWLKGINSSNGVSDFIAENDKLSYWVRKFILKSDRQFERSENLRFVLLVAEECRKLRNFSSACAIFAGMASSSITGLKRTSALSGANERLFLDLRNLASQERNFQAYRRALRSSKAPCVPLLSVHLRDLTAVHKADSTFIEEEGHSDVINFELYQHVYEEIRDILRYQNPPPKLVTSSRHLEIQVFIEGQLRSLVVDDALRDRLHQRAARFAREELVNFTRREDELKATGFMR